MAGRKSNLRNTDKSLLLQLVKKFVIIKNNKTDATTTKVIDYVLFMQFRVMTSF